MDCTDESNRVLVCRPEQVAGFPTVKSYWKFHSTVYGGARDLASLERHANALAPQCTLADVHRCSDAQLEEIERQAAMTAAERDALLHTLQGEIAAAQDEHDRTVQALQARFQESVAALNERQSEINRRLALLKDRLAARGAGSASKDGLPG